MEPYFIISAVGLSLHLLMHASLGQCATAMCVGRVFVPRQLRLSLPSDLLLVVVIIMLAQLENDYLPLSRKL